MRRLVTREAILESITGLSVTPRVIRHLATFIGDPNQDISEAVTALAVEPVLTAAIVAAANAPTHYRGERATHLAQAVHRLGLRETYRIALLITFRQGLYISNLPDSRAADYLWRRAVTTACAMEELADPPVDPNTAYTIGLLHLIGCLILARAGAGDLGFDCSHPAALARAQAAAGELTHAEAAALALEHWDFPPEVCAAIRWQFSPHSAGSHVLMALLLSRAVNLSTFIEECRPDSPIYRPPPISQFIGEREKAIEARAYDLMALFHVIPPERPVWAAR